MALEVTIPSIQPAQFWEAVSPSDSTILTGVLGVYVGDVSGGSALVMTDQDGNDATWTVVAGQFLPVSPSKIKSTGTSAASIVILK